MLAELLLKPGINPNIRNENFDAPLHVLVKSSRKDKVELLISLLTHSSADVNLQAADEMTALHFAVQVCIPCRILAIITVLSSIWCGVVSVARQITTEIFLVTFHIHTRI